MDDLEADCDAIDDLPVNERSVDVERCASTLEGNCEVVMALQTETIVVIQREGDPLNRGFVPFGTVGLGFTVQCREYRKLCCTAHIATGTRTGTDLSAGAHVP